MAPDFLIVGGTVLLALSVASAVAAWADARRPTVALAVVLAGVGMFAAAMMVQGGLGWRDVPEAFVRVIALVLN
ncbi:hypothetical protein HKCCE2091_11160 [Rhodobacterales bacterium HKCCE2091]|nr:hypothetical protein [Rhodobacterales bacterium HKCCE2091]